MTLVGFFLGLSFFVIGIFAYWVDSYKQTAKQPLKLLSWIATLLMIGQGLSFIFFLGMQHRPMEDIIWLCLCTSGTFLLGRRFGLVSDE